MPINRFNHAVQYTDGLNQEEKIITKRSRADDSILVDALASVDYAKHTLTNEENKTLALLTEKLTALFAGGYLNETQIVILKNQIFEGTVSTEEGMARLFTLLEEANSKVNQQKDNVFSAEMRTVYHDSRDKSAIIADVKNKITHYAVYEMKSSHIDTNDKSAKEYFSVMTEQISLLNSVHSSFNFNDILAKIMFEIGELRKLALQQRAKEREATLKQQLESADATRQAGQERMKAALISGILTISAGVISSGMTVHTYAKSPKAGEAAKIRAEAKLGDKSAEIAPTFTLEESNAVVKKAVKDFEKKANNHNENIRNSLKSSGELGSGIQQVNVANVEGKGKEHDTWAQNANNRGDAADKLADSLMQTILKLLDGFLQMQSLINQASSAVINKV